MHSEQLLQAPKRCQSKQMCPPCSPDTVTWGVDSESKGTHEGCCTATACRQDIWEERHVRGRLPQLLSSPKEREHFPLLLEPQH